MKRLALAVIVAVATASPAVAGQKFSCGQLALMSYGASGGFFRNCGNYIYGVRSDTTRRIQKECTFEGKPVTLTWDFDKNTARCYAGWNVHGVDIIDEPALPSPIGGGDTGGGDEGGGGGGGDDGGGGGPSVDPDGVPSAPEGSLDPYDGAPYDFYPVGADGYPITPEDYVLLPIAGPLPGVVEGGPVP